MLKYSALYHVYCIIMCLTVFIWPVAAKISNFTCVVYSFVSNVSVLEIIQALILFKTFAKMISWRKATPKVC